MEITSELSGDYLDVRATGRLDGYWATHFATTLDEMVRQGHHLIRVNLSGVTYISSMGVGVLVDCYKNLVAIQGVLVVTDPSPVVRKVLDMVDLTTTLMTERAAAKGPRPAAATPSILERGDARYEVFQLAGSGVRCRVVGDPSLLDGCRFARSHCAPVSFGAEGFGLGLGAFGSSFEDCQNRFGEFLAVTGAAAYQPADGSNAADFMLGSHTAFPEVQVLYGLSSEGTCSRMARFEATSDVDAITVSALADTCLQIAGTPAAWVVMVAESAGLAGVSLRRPPVNGESAGAPFDHPDVRRWLSFTTERAHVRSLVIVTGIVLSAPNRELEALTRPLSKASPITGHLHAAAFSYRPLQKGLIALEETVRNIFEHQTLQGVLHLIGDDHQSDRVSESELVRGALWVAPVHEVTGARSAA